MKIVKLDAIDSTNEYLKKLLRTKALDDYTVVVAKEQRSGRGQMGATWHSESGKNLTFSVLKSGDDLHVSQQFWLSMGVSLAIYAFLKSIGIENLSVKWPNDILSGTSKICGVLIENMLSGTKISTSVIGIGLNVNQLEFTNLANASSLQLLMGRTYVLEELLPPLLGHIKETFDMFTDYQRMQEAYENVLFGKNVPMMFSCNGEMVKGTILGISPMGKLTVALGEEGHVRNFGIKEIRQLL